jgi:hypothetical protein
MHPGRVAVYGDATGCPEDRRSNASVLGRHDPAVLQGPALSRAATTKGRDMESRPSRLLLVSPARRDRRALRTAPHSAYRPCPS